MTESHVVSSIGPVLSFVAGFVAKWIVDWQDDVRRTRREREARMEARRDVLQQRRSDFQRKNLLDLQEACMKLVRSAGRQHHADTMAFRQTGKWQGHLLPEDVSDACALAQRETTVLMVRAADEQLRIITDDLKAKCAALGKVTSEADGDALLSATGTTHDTLNRRIGEVLRSLDTEDTAAAQAR